MTEKAYEFASLSTFPELAEQTNSLIEEAFGYRKTEHFTADFAPLTDQDNFKNRHVLFEPVSKRVVAHIGCHPRLFFWNGEVIPVVLIGGIAVSEDARGQGLFNELFMRILSLYHSQCAFFLLWSDKHEMYEKYGFYLAGRQWCYRAPGEENHGERVSLDKLPTETLNEMRELYQQKVNQLCFSPLRDEEDWRHLKDITSTELYLLRKQGKLQGYYFRNKGMDLEGIVHDWAHAEGVAGLLRDAGNPGVVWAAHNSPVPDEVLQDLQLVGLWRPNTHAMALKKLSVLLEGAKVEWNDPYFGVKNERGTFRLSPSDLLEEIFSLGKHGVLAQNVPVWVGGLDSI